MIQMRLFIPENGPQTSHLSSTICYIEIMPPTIGHKYSYLHESNTHRWLSIYLPFDDDATWTFW